MVGQYFTMIHWDPKVSETQKRSISAGLSSAPIWSRSTGSNFFVEKRNVCMSTESPSDWSESHFHSDSLHTGNRILDSENPFFL